MSVSLFPTEISIVQVLLVVLVYLLWEVLKWLKLVAGSLGCNPYRTKRIDQLMKQLAYDDPINESKLNKPERERLDEDLKELFKMDLFEGPAKAGQSIKLIEKLDAVMKLLQSRLEPPSTLTASIPGRPLLVEPADKE